MSLSSGSVVIRELCMALQRGTTQVVESEERWHHSVKRKKVKESPSCPLTTLVFLHPLAVLWLAGRHPGPVEVLCTC